MTQRNKNILLILGFVAALLIAYQVAFSKTIAVKNEVKSLKEQSISFQDLANLSATLDQREKFADSVLKKNNIKNISIQNNLLEFLNQESTDNDFIISNFSEPHQIVADDTSIISYQFVLEGNFDDLLNVVYKLEQDYNFGKISHLNFKKKRDFRKRKDYLECFVIVEGLVSD
jgi:hypothetical protein